MFSREKRHLLLVVILWRTLESVKGTPNWNHRTAEMRADAGPAHGFLALICLTAKMRFVGLRAGDQGLL